MLIEKVSTLNILFSAVACKQASILFISREPVQSKHSVFSKRLFPFSQVAKRKCASRVMYAGKVLSLGK